MTVQETRFGVVQCAFGDDMQDNIAKTAGFIKEAAERGAQVILTPELFQGRYFCTAQDPKWFADAYPADAHPCVIELAKLAKELRVALPVSIFEKDGHEYYNSIAMLDDCGDIMGIYRKTHIPDGVGYQEKYYFKPGNLGFKVWNTRYGVIGTGICWDQWFPEAARAMMVQGAEFLLYPTAIGSELYDDNLDTCGAWRRAQQGHAASNAVPVMAANRIGDENANGNPQRYYGNSFICAQDGEVVTSFGNTEEGVLIHAFDRAALAKYRADWGFFRDRRPNTYGALIT